MVESFYIPFTASTTVLKSVYIYYGKSVLAKPVHKIEIHKPELIINLSQDTLFFFLLTVYYGYETDSNTTAIGHSVLLYHCMLG